MFADEAEEWKARFSSGFHGNKRLMQTRVLSIISNYLFDDKTESIKLICDASVDGIIIMCSR